MRLLAVGWTKPGDKFKAPDDKAWWGKRYAHPLWPGLKTWVAVIDNSRLGGNVAWSEEIANGNTSAISRELGQIADELRTIETEKCDHCAPYIIPKRENTWPLPNVVCLTSITVRKGMGKIPLRDPLGLKIDIPFWAWVLIGIAASKLLSRR